MSAVTSSLAAVLILLGIALAIFASPIALIPIVLVVGALVVLPPTLAFIAERGDPGSPEPTGVPTTREASYDPVADPSSRY